MACKQRPSFTAEAVTPVVISGISPPFGRLSQARGQVTYVLLTRAPLYSGSCPLFSLGLHLFGTPPAFVLSQGPTLQFGAGAPTSTKGEQAGHVELRATHPTWPARRVALSVRSRLGTFSARQIAWKRSATI